MNNSVTPPAGEKAKPEALPLPNLVPIENLLTPDVRGSPITKLGELKTGLVISSLPKGLVVPIPTLPVELCTTN